MNTTFRRERFIRNSMSLLRAISLVLLSVVLAGCPAGRTVTEKKVVICGSNTFGEELGPRLIALYEKEHPAVTFETGFKATGYGVGALLADQCDIAAASRVLNANELEAARSHGIEFNDYIIGSYSVAVIVNAASPVGNLTRDQVRDVFTGVARNWKEVGGPDAAIHLYIRDQISGTHLGFRELAMENKPYGSGLKAFTTYRDIVQAVAHDPNGIGYASIDLGKNADVKAVSIGGVAPTAVSVSQGQYPYARVLHLYTAKGKESAAARDFVQFVQSSRGQQIVHQMGFVPHP
jgi:phosphate transport system substrate-binding protein